MRFALSDEQVQAAAALRGLLARDFPAAALRARWEGAADDGAPWSSLCEMGLASMLTPEAHGGLGGDELDLVSLLEECGRAGVPGPVVETCWVAPRLLPAARLAALAAGSLKVACGDGEAPLVADADVADVLLLCRGDDAFALDRARVELSARQPSVDGARAIFEVRWDPRDGDAIGPASELRARAASGLAAALLGLSRRMLDMTTEYVQVRRQFGAPIGSFQAVKHPLANALVRLSVARPVVLRAAYSLARRDPERALHASMAKAFAAEAALLSARVALQAHGAIGYSFEHDLHLFMKRAWALSAAFGGPLEHRERIASHLFDPRPTENP